MQELNHNHIVKLYDYYERPHEQLLVMELMEEELFDLISRKGKHSEDETRMFMLQILDALDFMHSKGIMHRDMKPENLLLTSKGPDAQLKLADFGFAHHVEGEQMGDICGTPDYIAPEMIKQIPYVSPNVRTI